MSGNKKTLGVLAITMINVIAVDSLRTLPFSAEYGLSLVFYYLMGALLFFLPVALISAELATAWPNKGGIYVWVREAFGARWGFWVIWMQWIYNVFWYPTALSFVAGAMAYLIDPQLVDHPTFMLGIILSLFWGMTLLNLLGMRLASWFSTLAALLGTLIPMLLIIGLGINWLGHGHPTAITLSKHHLLPQAQGWQHLSFLVAILFGLMGMEMSASHADEVRNPGRTFPRAIAYSSVIILLTLILASLAIAIIVPHQQLNVITGMVQAFHLFFSALDLQWLEPWIVGCMVIGGLGGVAAWIIGPTKGLMVAAQDGAAPRWLATTNAQGMPVAIMLLQAIVFSLLSSAYILMPSVKSAYWLLTAMTAQMAFLVYISLFAAMLTLRRKHGAQRGSFRMPGGTWGAACCSLLGLATCVAAIALGFVPPAQVPVGNVWHYELILIAGLATMAAVPWVLFRRRGG